MEEVQELQKTEEELYVPSPAHKWCIISAVGNNSQHRHWISSTQKYDVHLIVYDNTYEKYKSDTPFIRKSEGYKFQLVYKYLQENKQFIDHYDYFYLPDDDIYIEPEQINKLFRCMKKYGLAIAQPAIANSYYSHSHTRKKWFSKIRYTNFVEIMQPCFSRDAIKKTLFTFNENSSGWGLDFHWGELVDFRKKNMAVLHNIHSVHTRPVQSSHGDELTEYLEKYNLTTKIYESI